MPLLSKIRSLVDSVTPETALRLTAAEPGMTQELASAAQIAAQESLYKRKLAIELGVTIGGLGIAMLFSYWALEKLMKKMDPTSEEKRQSELSANQLMESIGISLEGRLTDYELCIASNLVDTRTIDVCWDDIGGLQPIIEEIKEAVILPFTRPELFSSSNLLQPPKGVLLYGPPGCGKTMIAKATAKASGARFINLQASSLFDKWYGESQKRAEAIFSLAQRIQPTIIFIDEIDAFLRERGSNDHESTALIKAQFMTLWDGLATSKNSRVLIMGATNRPYDVDPAFRRRMPCMMQIDKPIMRARQQILQVILKDEDINDKDNIIREVAEKTDDMSGSDLQELCRHAAIFRVRDYLNREPDSGRDSHPVLRKMNLQDFMQALEKFHSVALELTSLRFGNQVHDGVE